MCPSMRRPPFDVVTLDRTGKVSDLGFHDKTLPMALRMKSPQHVFHLQHVVNSDDAEDAER